MPLPRVQKIVTDFEMASFCFSSEAVSYNCMHLGCNFNWCQAVMKKVRDFHLSALTTKKGQIRFGTSYSVCFVSHIFQVKFAKLDYFDRNLNF